MEIDLTHSFDAPIQVLWDILLDPQKMAKCVPGMQSVDVVSDTEYLAQVKIKIAFISASFKVRTVITEQTPPSYLRCESTGEDKSVGSSVKSVSEMFLTKQDDNKTELRVTAAATVFGRLGTLGLNPMRTKAERMWEEFCRNVEAEFAGPSETEPAKQPTATTSTTQATSAALESASEPSVETIVEAPTDTVEKPGLLARICRRLAGRNTVRVEIRRNETVIVLHWPVDHADQCLAWLNQQLDRS